MLVQRVLVTMLSAASDRNRLEVCIVVDVAAAAASSRSLPPKARGRPILPLAVGTVLKRELHEQRSVLIRANPCLSVLSVLSVLFVLSVLVRGVRR